MQKFELVAWLGMALLAGMVLALALQDIAYVGGL